MHKGTRLAIGLVAAVVLTTPWVSRGWAAEGATLKVDPPVVAVAKGQTFALQVVQNSSEDTSGAQASVDFDPSILRVVSVQRGSGYAASPFFMPQDLQADIKTANATGHLAQVAAAFTPPDRVPAGAASFLLVRFEAVGCGQTDVSLPTTGPLNAQMISGQSAAYGHEIPVTTVGGRVTTCVGPDLVTGQDIAPGQTDPAGSGLPLPLLGSAAAVAIAAAVGAVVLRSRRRQPPDEEFVE